MARRRTPPPVIDPQAYTPTTWVDNVTPVNAANLNKIEQALANPPPSGADLSFDGDWVAGTYADGDVVVKDGVSFMCVGGPTTVAPDPTLWGALANQIPAVQNGKWLKGAGGAMVWGNPAGMATTALSGTLVDLALPDPHAILQSIRPATIAAGCTIRSIGIPANPGARVEFQIWSSYPQVVFLHNTAGGTGAVITVDGGGNVIAPPGSTCHFTYTGSEWQFTGLTKASSQTDYSTTLPSAPIDGQEAILTDSLTAPSYAWRFRYNASIADAHKWQFIGGSAAVSMYDSDSGLSPGANLPDSGNLTFTVPRAGVYDLDFRSAFAAAGGQAVPYVQCLFTVAGAVPSGQGGFFTNMYTPGVYASLALNRRVTAAAGNVIGLTWGLSTPGPFIHVKNRILTVAPVRVA